MLFHPYWREHIPRIIEMLDSDELYVRYAAYVLLQQKAGRYDKRYEFGMAKADRNPAVEAWREWWKENATNTRLDRPAKRVCEAGEWDKGE